MWEKIDIQKVIEAAKSQLQIICHKERDGIHVLRVKPVEADNWKFHEVVITQYSIQVCCNGSTVRLIDTSSENSMRNTIPDLDCYFYDAVTMASKSKRF
jgi:hypothetical protein